MRIGTIIVHPSLGPVEVTSDIAANVVGADGFEHHLGAAALEACYPASLNQALRYWIARCHNAEGRDVPRDCDHAAGACKAEAMPDRLPKDIGKPVDPRAQGMVDGGFAGGDFVAETRRGPLRTFGASPAVQAYRDVERATQVADNDLEARAAAEGFGLVVEPEAGQSELHMHRQFLAGIGLSTVVIDTCGVPTSALRAGRYVWAGE